MLIVPNSDWKMACVIYTWKGKISNDEGFLEDNRKPVLNTFFNEKLVLKLLPNMLFTLQLQFLISSIWGIVESTSLSQTWLGLSHCQWKRSSKSSCVKWMALKGSIELCNGVLMPTLGLGLYMYFAERNVSRNLLGFHA